MLALLEENFPDDLRVIYRHFPLISIHDKAALSTQAAEAAGAQGHFWEMHDILYGRQDVWTDLSQVEFRDWVLERASELELDTDQFITDLDANAEFAQAAWDFGVEAQIRGTPFLVIQGRPYGGPLDYANLSTVLKLTLLEEQQFSECPKMTIDPSKEYVATISTEKGDIMVKLFPDKAPMAVNSFVFLAQEGWFNGVTFHRVIPGFVAQAGDPSGTGYGGPGYAFDNEVSDDLSFDRAGLMAMANAGPGSNGSQFFITYAAQPDLDGGYTIFGEVISGLDTAESLTPRNPQQSIDLPPGDMIESVTISVR